MNVNVKKKIFDKIKVRNFNYIFNVQTQNKKHEEKAIKKNNQTPRSDSEIPWR
jgi:hypothetical protein